MKTTGIVRRIDNLGRIVIPKEMRKSLRIIENDILEISLENEAILLRKVSTFADSMNYFDDLLKFINKLYGFDIFIADSSIIYSYAGQNRENFIGKNISEYILNCIKNRNIIDERNNATLQIIDENTEQFLNCNYLLVPIINSGDVYGILGIINYKNTDNIVKIGKIIAKIIELRVSNF